MPELTEETRGPTPFSQSVWDTSALIFFGSAFLFPVMLLPVGIVMIWISKRWTTREKLGATLAPFVVFALGAALSIVTEYGGALSLFAFITPTIAAFFLAFRMGTRSSRAIRDDNIAVAD